MKKYENFKAALNNLKDIYDYEEPYSNVETAGMEIINYYWERDRYEKY